MKISKDKTQGEQGNHRKFGFQCFFILKAIGNTFFKEQEQFSDNTKQALILCKQHHSNLKCCSNTKHFSKTSIQIRSSVWNSIVKKSPQQDLWGQKPTKPPPQWPVPQEPQPQTEMQQPHSLSFFLFFLNKIPQRKNKAYPDEQSLNELKPKNTLHLKKKNNKKSQMPIWKKKHLFWYFLM